MKQILILGSNGFIGRNIKDYFSKMDSYEILTPNHRELNLLDELAVKQYLNTTKPDTVIHAAVCRNPRYFRNELVATELEQDLRMYYALEKYNDLYGKMLYFGSGAEFDKRFDICSIKEDEYLNGIPSTEYGLAKYIIGKSIEKSRNIYNLRLFGLFGQYENWKTTFISGACCKALKQLPITIRQNVVFDYLYIDDFCPIIQWFIENEPQYHTYNIASGQRVDLLSIAKKVKELSGNDVPIYVCQPGFGNEYSADNERLKNENKNFRVTPLDVSIRKLLNYYQSIIDTVDLQSLLYQ